ncbi:MAG: hypothetical protein ABI807_13900 [Sporichthyaceae bacterium]
MTSSSPAGAPPADLPSRSRLPVAAAVVALLAMVPVAFFYAASGLVVPGPWLYLMWLLLGLLVVVAVALTRRRSYWELATPVVGGAAWWGIISAGEAWLGWTA